MDGGARLFAEYGAYHRDRTNLICHEIGIPLIVLAIVALLRLVHVGIGRIDLGGIAVIAVMAYYLSLGPSVRRARVVAFAALVVLWLLAAWIPWPVAVAAFVAGWVFQFAGHRAEGTSPAFLTNLVHLLVGPLWVASRVVPSSTSSSSAR